MESQTRSQEAISRLLEAASYTEREAQRESPPDDDIEEVDMDEQIPNWNAFRSSNGRVSSNVCV